MENLTYVVISEVSPAPLLMRPRNLVGPMRLHQLSGRRTTQISTPQQKVRLLSLLRRLHRQQMSLPRHQFLQSTHQHLALESAHHPNPRSLIQRSGNDMRARLRKRKQSGSERRKRKRRRRNQRKPSRATRVIRVTKRLGLAFVFLPYLHITLRLPVLYHNCRQTELV